MVCVCNPNLIHIPTEVKLVLRLHGPLGVMPFFYIKMDSQACSSVIMFSLGVCSKQFCGCASETLHILRFQKRRRASVTDLMCLKVKPTAC